MLSQVFVLADSWRGLLLASAFSELTEETPQSEYVRLSCSVHLYGSVFACQIAFKAFAASVKGSAIHQIDVGGAYFFAFPIVLDAAGTAVVDALVFAFLRTSLHDAFTRVHFRLDKRIYRGYSSEKSTNRT